MKKSLANKLLFYFVLLNFISILLVGAYAYFKAKDALFSRTFDQLTSVRIEKQKRVENFFLQRRTEARSHQIEMMSTGWHFSDRTRLTTGFLQIKNYFLDIYVIDSAGIILHASEKSMPQILEQDLLFAEGHPDFGVFSNKFELYEKTILGEQNPSVFLFFDPNISEIDFVALRLDMESVYSIMLDRNPQNGLGNSGEVYLVGNDTLLRSVSRFEENSAYRISSNTIGVKEALAGKTAASIFDDYRGISVLSSYSPLNIDILNWAILAEIDREEAMIPIRSFGFSIAYILIILSLLLLGVVALLANTITAPLRKLRDETEKISAGEYEKLIEIRSDDEEIKALSRSFTNMAHKIQEQQENIKEARDQSVSSMIDGQEAERSRLSRELHDGLAQTILAIKMKIENTPPKNAAGALIESQELFENLMKEIRHMSNDLMPAVLREFGLLNALEGLLKSIQLNSKIQTSIMIEGQIPPLSRKSETYLYRIAQEASNNIIKHSGADTMEIRIKMIGENLIYQIIDNGRGIEKTDQNNGNGISNIRDRISIMKGKVYFYPNKPKGLKIHCEIPVKNILDV